MAVKKAKTQARPQNRINKQKEMEQRKIKRRRKKIVVTLFIAIVVGISAYFSMSPTFKIQTVTVNGNAQLSREKIMEIAGIKIGDNIFSKIGIVLKVKLKCSDEEDYVLTKLGSYSYCSSEICEKDVNKKDTNG